jgi:hypothetical protein
MSGLFQHDRDMRARRRYPELRDKRGARKQLPYVLPFLYREMMLIFPFDRRRTHGGSTALVPKWRSTFQRLRGTPSFPTCRWHASFLPVQSMPVRPWTLHTLGQRARIMLRRGRYGSGASSPIPGVSGANLLCWVDPPSLCGTHLKLRLWRRRSITADDDGLALLIRAPPPLLTRRSGGLGG